MTSHAVPHSTIGHIHDGHQYDALGHHVMPVRTLIAVFLSLIFLTFITVFVTFFDLGPLNLMVAMGIATIKALLVMLWFMHLKYDKPFNLMLFFSSFGFVALFIGLVIMDTEQYQPSIEARTQALRPASPMPPPAPAAPAADASGTAPAPAAGTDAAAPAGTPAAPAGAAAAPAESPAPKAETPAPK